MMKAALLLVSLTASAVAQTAAVQGTIRDSKNQPVASASVSLSFGEGKPALKARTEADGTYHFRALAPGSYAIRAEKAGVGLASFGPFVLGEKETRTLDLTLHPANAQVPQFYDEPQFVVAGVTDSTYQGGHGSDVVLRSAEALAKATASLTKEAPASGLRVQAEAEEKAGNPVGAARDYQHAADLDPSEPNLFDWGTELLIHRAAVPAIEVFGKGNRLFPGSSRMLLGLAAAWYARGAYDEAAKYFYAASDLNPADPTPYLFLGEIQTPAITNSDGYQERLARFARLHPENALANYYYAAGLWKRRKGPDDNETPVKVEGLIEKAILLDSALGPAYLLRGIVYSSLQRFEDAIAAYQKAVAVSPELEEAHYRLSLAYRRTGEVRKGRVELDLYNQLSKKAAEETKREREAVARFAVTLRGLPPR
jgi:tetratricopeptide (TPR) repeat protein